VIISFAKIREHNIIFDFSKKYVGGTSCFSFKLNSQGFYEIYEYANESNPVSGKKDLENFIQFFSSDKLTLKDLQ
jgi:hypothetical protein